MSTTYQYSCGYPIRTCTAHPYHAFLYSNGTITNPGNFWPNAINDNGVMVGGHLIDSGGTVQDLNTLVPAGDQISDATVINDNGQIVANGSDASTSQAALLLTPA